MKGIRTYPIAYEVYESYYRTRSYASCRIEHMIIHDRIRVTYRRQKFV